VCGVVLHEVLLCELHCRSGVEADRPVLVEFGWHASARLGSKTLGKAQNPLKILERPLEWKERRGS
jgi:hypothetical protein